MAKKQTIRVDIGSTLRERLSEKALKRYVSNDAMLFARVYQIYRPPRRGVARYKLSPEGARTVDRARQVWGRVNAEIHDLICTNSEKYRAVRAGIATKDFKASQKAIGYLIAGAIGAYAGLTVAII